MIKFLFGKPTPESGATAFSYHKKSGIRAILGGFLMAAAVETIAVHIVVSLWSHYLAWLLTLSSVWLALTIIAQIRAVRLPPLAIKNDLLIIRNGMYELAELPLSQIESVKKCREESSSDAELKPLVACMPASPNLKIELKEPAMATLLYGMKRKFKVAMLCLDEPEKFIEAIGIAFQKNKD